MIEQQIGKVLLMLPMIFSAVMNNIGGDTSNSYEDMKVTPETAVVETIDYKEAENFIIVVAEAEEAVVAEFTKPEEEVAVMDTVGEERIAEVATEETIGEELAEEAATEETIGEELPEETATEETVSEELAEEAVTEETVSEELEEEVATEETVSEELEEETAAEDAIVPEDVFFEETEATEETEWIEEFVEATDAAEEIWVTEFWEEDDVFFEVITEEALVEETVIEETYVPENDWHTGRLTAPKGYVTDSPCGGSETWYPDAPVGAVHMMENLYGFKNLKMTVREDGVRVLSGTRPNGEEFEGLVVVAADVRDVTDKFVRNINGVFERGELIETSLGPGIVVDYCLRAVNERKATGHLHIDIATAWYT